MLFRSEIILFPSHDNDTIGYTHFDTYKLCNTNTNNIISKKLDNEQQSHVEWKVGEWAWNGYSKDFLGTIKSIDKTAYYAIELDNQDGKTDMFCNLDMLVKPTKEEIEQHLVKIAKEKYPIGTKVKEVGTDVEYTVTHDGYRYVKSLNDLSFISLEEEWHKGHSNPTIWQNGVWAEPITEQKERFKVDVCKHSTQNNYRIEVKLNGVDVRLPKEEAERAAQAIRETLKNL